MRGLLLLLAMLAAIPAGAAEWSRFRGPDGAGLAEARNLPIEFDPARNLAWKAPVPPGKSSPVVAGNRIYLTGHEGDRLLTLAIEGSTGKRLWKREVNRSRQENRHKLNDAAAPTVATDGSNVFAFFPDFGVVSYTAAGVERWRAPLGPHRNMHGIAGSPAWHAGRVFVVIDQETDAYLVALDAATGRVVWRIARPPALGGSYSSPVVWTPVGESEQLLVLGSRELVAYSLEQGEKLWWVGGFPFQAKSSPLVLGNEVLCAVRAPGGDTRMDLGNWEQILKDDRDRNGTISPDEASGLLKGAFAVADIDRDGRYAESEHKIWREAFDKDSEMILVRPTGRGDITRNAVRWRVHKNVSEIPMPLALGDLVYTVVTGGIFTSHDRGSGEVRKRGRLNGALGPYFASPVAGDGKIYILSQEGKVSVIRPGAEWELLAVNDLGEECFGTPALAHDSIYVRTSSALYRFRSEQ